MSLISIAIATCLIEDCNESQTSQMKRRGNTEISVKMAASPTFASAPHWTQQGANSPIQNGLTSSLNIANKDNENHPIYFTDKTIAAANPTEERDSTPIADPLKYAARQIRLFNAIEDMSRSNELKPVGGGSGWKYRPMIVMGTEPYASSLPKNWNGIKFKEWRAVLTWFVIYEGEGGNFATNSAVEINGIELWFYSIKSRSWKIIQSNATPTWNGAYALNAIDKSDTKNYLSLNNNQALFAPTSSTIVHGGLGQAPTPWDVEKNTDDIGAFYISVRHRLALKQPNGPDDRDIANFTLNTGADYYPWIGSKLSDLKAAYVPGVGLGRFLKVTKNWRYSTFFTKKAFISLDEIKSSTPPNFQH